ncbi:MAG: hypothetical protein ACO1RA_22700 [Planctomycetaceae bacterium]
MSIAIDSRRYFYPSAVAGPAGSQNGPADFAALLTGGSASGSEGVNAVAVEVNSNEAEKQRLGTAFQEWQQTYFHQGVTADRITEVQENAAAFEKIMQRAIDQGGINDPQAFLRSLTTEELRATQKIHGLAESIQPQGLSKEASLNLLLPPSEVQDIDHDGFLSVGAAKEWTFPPVNAPSYVKQAWKEAIAGMDFGDILMMQASFMPLPDVGLPVGAEKSAYLGENTSYTDLTQHALDGAEFSKRFDEPWQRESREKQISFLQTFLQKLQSLS